MSADKSRDWLLVVSAPERAGYLLPADPVRIAYHLVQQAGGTKQARAAITAKLDKRERGRPREINDEFWLCMAANLQHRAKIDAKAGNRTAYWEIVKTKRGAIEELVGQLFPGQTKTITKRLLEKLGTRPLSDLVADPDQGRIVRAPKNP